MTTHGSSFTLHIIAGALIAAALMTASTAVAAATPAVTSDSFAPGWQSHAKALIYIGGIGHAGQQSWLVPGLLAKGRYVVIDRDGDKAELVQGYQFEVPSDANLRIKLWMPSGYNHLEALPAGDIPAANLPPRERPAPL